MSQENAVRVRENLEAFDRRDRAAFLSDRDPACEVIPDRNWPEAGVIRGREAAWDFYMSVAEALGLGSDDAEIIDAAGDKVVTHRGAQARGQSSGAGVVFDYSVVTTFRKGKIFREQWFADRSAALEAAGLSAQAMSQENIEFVRRMHEAIGTEAALDYFNPEVVVINSPNSPNTAPYVGHAGLVAWVRDVRDPQEGLAKLLR